MKTLYSPYLHKHACSLIAIAVFAGSAAAQSAPVERTADARSILGNLKSDQKNIWTFPARVARGQHILPVLGILGVTGALIATDPHDTPYFRRTDSFKSFNSALSGASTAGAIAAVPLAFYAIGHFRSNDKAKTTAWLAGEAVADSEIVSYVMKTIDQRLVPSGFPRNAKNFSDSWWDAKGAVLGAHGSFPSGHAVSAFSVATVVARRYGNHRWVPYAAYGLAAAISFSRLTGSAHYPSDLFMGAALGYTISRFAVLRQ